MHQLRAYADHLRAIVDCERTFLFVFSNGRRREGAARGRTDFDTAFAGLVNDCCVSGEHA